MAYDFFEEQDQQEDAQQQQADTGMVQIGPEGTTIKDQAQPAQKGPTSSGSYTNLQSYLDANKSLGFGGQVAGKVQGEVDKATQAQDTAAQSFKSQSDAGKVELSDELEQSVRQSPESVVSDQGKFSEFLRARDAEYQGPKNLVDLDIFSETDRAQRQATEAATAAGSEGGRKALLDKYYGTGSGRFDYNAGQQKLDNLLVQNDPQSRDAFQEVGRKAQEASQGYQDLRGALSSYAGQNQANTAAARARARAAVGIDEAGNYLPTDATRGNAGAVQDLVEGIDERLAARTGDLAATRQVLDPIRGAQYLRDVSPEALAKLGVDQEAINRGVDLTPIDRALGDYAKYYSGYKVDPGYLYQRDPGDLGYLSYTDPNALSRDSVTRQEELARLNALAQLAGKENTFIADPSLVGSQVDAPLYGFKGSEFSSDVAGRRSQFEAELQAVRDRFDRLSKGTTQVNGGVGTSTSGGIYNPASEMAEVNAVRARYGLPPITV